MAAGYDGRILRVDLSRGRVEAQPFDEQMARKFIGGSGVAAKIVWDETATGTDPLSPENPLIFMTGPLTGTAAPMSSRITIASLSPLTGIWGEAHSGGSWPDELKRTGFDGIVVQGKAKEPVYLYLNDGEAKLVSARHLWGKDTWETDDILKNETEPKAVTLTIGQAGERLVKIACMISGGRRESRGAARCGLGAVMGSKNLKAIVVRGTRRPQVHNLKGLKESVKKNYLSKITEYKPEKRNQVYADAARSMAASGKDPIKNWLQGEFEGYTDAFAAELSRGEPLFCRGCWTSCLESSKDGNVRRTMAGAIQALGSDCLISDMPAVRAAYHLCNQFGIDHKSAGAIIAFAMECFEKGLITKADTEGIELTWGNSGAMVSMVGKIGLREGFGAVLGEGAKRAAEIIGRNASDYAMHSKGLEIPNWEPRSSNYRALGQATGNIGADPYNSLGPVVRNTAIPELGIPADEDKGKTLYAIEGKGGEVARGQNFGVLTNCLGTCWMNLFMWMPHGQHVAPSTCLEWLNHVTGWSMDLKEFLRCGERIFNLQRMINVRRGITRKDDSLPARFLTEKLLDGPNAGHVSPLGEMLCEYYSYREWTEDGIPTREKLVELGLEETVGEIPTAL